MRFDRDRAIPPLLVPERIDLITSGEPIRRRRCMPRTIRLAVLAGVLACGGGDSSTSPSTNPSQPAVAAVTVTPADTLIPIGSTGQLTAVIRDASGAILTGRSIVWTTSSATVATVNGAGTVSGVSAGTATITAMSEGRSGTATVRVATPVASVTLTPTNAQLPIGATQQFTATPKDANGNPLAGRTVTWTTSDAAIVSVNGAGLATAVSPGLVTITATVEGQSASAPVRVQLSTLPVVTVAIVPATLNLQITQLFQLRAVPRDVNGHEVGVAVTWATSNAAAVSVSGGVVAGQALGAVTITASVQGKSGTAAVTVQPQPARMVGTTLAAGTSHTCGLTPAGAAYCWGQNAGQLGNGTFTSSFVPVPVSGGLAFAAITAGRLHTCALTSQGAAWCWGDNGSGQLGRPATTTAANVPTLVTGIPPLNQITAGGDHTCGLTTDGVAYCWGLNANGQLGDNTQVTKYAPTSVGGGLTFADLSAGREHTCGVARTGTTYCWGANDFAQLGDGTKTRRLTPTPIGPAYFGTTLIPGVLFSRVFTGGWHTCGVTRAPLIARVYCWGPGGLIGDGTNTDRLNPQALTSFNSNALNIAAGGSASCSFANNPSLVWCWGSNAYGQLGDGTQTSQPLNTLLSPGLTFAMAAAGGDHMCALSVVGAATCWGRGESGQLGNGGTNFRTTMTPVSGGITFKTP